MEKEKKSDTCNLFPPAVEARDKKMSDTCSLFCSSGDPWPSCLLPSHMDTMEHYSAIKEGAG